MSAIVEGSGSEREEQKRKDRGDTKRWNEQEWQCVEHTINTRGLQTLGLTIRL